MLRVEGVSKRFGRVAALRDVSATLHPGEIHAVLGENGAGKSTLASVVAGFVRPDAGSLTLDGSSLAIGSPSGCKKLGVAMIHQHFMLVPELTVAENLALAQLDGPFGLLDVVEAARPALEAGKRIGWELDPVAKVSQMSVGARQRLEILKALGADARVILLDEPTAVLSRLEVSDLIRVLRSLAEQGKTLILIAHKLSEVMAAADRVTVLRKGRVVAEAVRGEFDEAKLAEWMVGEMPSSLLVSSVGFGSERLEVRDLEVTGDLGQAAVKGVSLTVSSGEIVGIGGVEGNGQTELAEAIAGVRGARSGSVFGNDGVAYIPEDRQRDGLALELSVSDNFLVTGHSFGDLRRGPFLRRGAVRAWVSGLISRFSISAPDPKAPAASLSGGNQQKIVVGRTLDRRPKVLVVCGPSRGLDVKATAFVHDQIRDAKAKGAAVVLFTADLDELAALSDRTLFMSRGRFVEGSDATAMLGGVGAA